MRLHLTLTNAHGSDTRTFQVIKVKADPTGINGTEAADMKVYAIDRDVLFDVETPGNYLVQVFSTNADGSKQGCFCQWCRVCTSPSWCSGRLRCEC